MTDATPTPTAEPYDVVVLVEEDLSPGDAERITSLHAGLDAPVRYHLLVPVDDAAARVRSAMGAFAAGEPLAAPAASADTEQAVADAERSSATRHLQTSLASLAGVGAQAAGETVAEDPVDALRASVAAVDAAEAIVVTDRHVVAEFLHVDWASQAQRHLGIPVLHLIEHESFSEQAGGPGGVTGL